MPIYLGNIVDAGATQLTTYGTPTVQDGIASGFSGSNYYSFGTFQPSGTFEIVMAVKNTNNVAKYFFGCEGSGNIVMGTRKSSGKMQFVVYLGSNGSSWDIGSGSPAVTIDETGSVEYLVRLRFTGTQYIFDHSDDDGKHYHDKFIIDSSTAVYPKEVLLGKAFNDSYAWGGSINLNKSYIKVGGEPWYGPCKMFDAGKYNFRF